METRLLQIERQNSKYAIAVLAILIRTNLLNIVINSFHNVH